MVQVRTGIDLVVIEEFARSLQRGGDEFRRRLFHPPELEGASLERLAGIFAAKEAAFKALQLPPGNWLILEIRHTPAGRPGIRFASEYNGAHIVSCDLSITHTAAYALASVVALVTHAAHD